MRAKIAYLPGDGIGPEVTREARRILDGVAEVFGHQFTAVECPIGGAAIDAHGEPLPGETREAVAGADAIFLGAVGGPAWDHLQGEARPESGLLDLRQTLNLFANLRPVKPHPRLARFSPLRLEILDGVDLLVVRELTGGIYFGEKESGPDAASDLCSYSRAEIERVVRRAGHWARQRRGKLTLVDKANVLATSRLWRDVTTEIVRREFSDLDFEVLLVDAAAMHLLTRPADFDVIVTENLFGDILTDEAGAICGSLGLLGSASLGPSRPGLFEPIHGSAPDLAGQGRANPVGAMTSAALLLRHGLGLSAEADTVDAAVAEVLATDLRTPDLGGRATTREVGDAVRERILRARLAA
ncbi:MAG: 3-isopropylmalate dehydrogenase [Candidatus Competibacterales bacterium]|nr:3-isopropylmalate dehydrogenase [Candidatus Competibacterales bacterium]